MSASSTTSSSAAARCRSACWRRTSIAGSLPKPHAPRCRIESDGEVLEEAIADVADREDVDEVEPRIRENDRADAHLAVERRGVDVEVAARGAAVPDDARLLGERQRLRSAQRQRHQRGTAVVEVRAFALAVDD